MSQTYQYGDYNRGGMLAFLFSMVTTLLFFVYVAFLHSGVDLQEVPKEVPKQELSTEPPQVEVSGEEAGAKAVLDTEANEENSGAGQGNDGKADTEQANEDEKKNEGNGDTNSDEEEPKAD